MMDSRRALLAPEEPKASWASRASAPPRLPVERVALFALAGASAGVGGLGGAGQVFLPAPWGFSLECRAPGRSGGQGCDPG